MKKNVSSLLVIVMVLFAMLSFTGCERLKVSNLEANYHLKKAHKFYTEEVYKSAANEYEKALSLNPKLDYLYLYIGTCYSMLYKPGKEDDKNKELSKKAIDNLLKARQAEPGNDKVIVALGDIYDKLSNYEEAKKYFLMILEKDKSNPKSYYTLGSFFRKNGKYDEATDMYLRRIALDPKAPDGYAYYADVLGEQRKFPEKIEAHKMGLYALIDPEIAVMMRDVSVLSKDVEAIQKTTDYIEKTLKPNTKLDKAEKDRLIAESQSELNAKITFKLPLAEAIKKLNDLKAQLPEKMKQAEAKIPSLSSDVKKEISIQYYQIGHTCWNWSYQTPKDMMVASEREGILEQGLNALKKAIEITPDYAEPYAYMGLLFREKIKVNPLKEAEYIKLNEEYNKKFADIYIKKKKSDEFAKGLEKAGKEEASKAVK